MPQEKGFLANLRKAGSSLADAATDVYTTTSDIVKGAYEGATVGYNGAVIITAGVKEVHVTKNMLEALLKGQAGEIVLDDMATDDGYEKVRITIAD